MSSRDMAHKISRDFPPFEGIKFFDELGCYFPLYDHKPIKCKAFVDAGLPAIDAALPFIAKRRTVVQAGGHAGFWPLKLSKHFDSVYTFEPEPLLFECMKRNTADRENLTLYQWGVGAAPGLAPFKSHVSAGSWRVDPGGESTIMLAMIDQLELPDCDAIMLDIEGYEVEALKGARETIERCSPVILVELLPRSRDAIHDHLTALKYKQVTRYGRDWIYKR